ncbi:helix-turn-helix domain-containing protein [Nonomuraea sp. NPDC050556]|uniref:helix-turn-helix domain-containing protein n=1 Tax=Nonomuraea sp. NPDC050556 TaxID=3364369 RepID=UPI0037A6CBA3
MNMGDFGQELRRWRLQRGLSQLTLADSAGTSQRHLSYMERGKANPGRSIVNRLAKSLDLPPKERNHLLLLAAGLAPELEQAQIPDPTREALEAVLTAHLPAPAVVVGPGGEVVAANDAVAVLTEGAHPDLLREPVSLCRLMLHPQGMAPRVANLPAWGHHVLEGLRDIARTTAPDEALRDVIAELSSYVPEEAQEPLGFAATLRLRTENGELRLISTITSLATAVDPALAGYRLEAFLPADEETASLLKEKHHESRLV